MKGILISEEKKRLVEAAKADLMLGSKHREASVLKWILGQCLFFSRILVALVSLVKLAV